MKKADGVVACRKIGPYLIENTNLFASVFPGEVVGDRWMYWVISRMEYKDRCRMMIDQGPYKIVRDYSTDELLARFLRLNGGAKYFQSQRHLELLDEKQFAWIDDDGRMPSWLVEVGFRRLDVLVSKDLRYSDAKNIEVLIWTIDNQDLDLSEKQWLLDDLQRLWGDRLKVDRCYSWFETEECDKCRVAARYIQAKGYLENVNEKELKDRNGIIYYLGNLGLGRDEERALIEEVKREYARVRSNERRKGRRQTNIILSEVARQKLDEMVKSKRSTISMVVESLIMDFNNR